MSRATSTAAAGGSGRSAAMVGAISLGVVGGLWLLSSWSFEPSLQEYLSETQAKPGWTFLAIVFLMIAHNVVPVPAEAIAIAAGALLGPTLGGMAIWIGAMLGACLAFAMSRVWGRALILYLLPVTCTDRIDRVAEVCTWRALLALRLVPIISFNLVNYCAGLASIPWFTFLWTTAIGIVPVIVLSVGIGAGLLISGLELPMLDWHCLAS